MKYFVIAGEASGDLHASRLIAALKREDNAAEVHFFGGEEMAEAAGGSPIVHYRDMAYMGFVDVILHLRQIAVFMRRAEKEISQWLPDAVILVDYPSFNLKIARYAHSLSIPVFWFISPKVWAWKEHRVKEIKKYVTEMYSILPFEVDFYKARHDYDIKYVGNPSVGEIDAVAERLPNAAMFAQINGLPLGRPIIALLPGSRRSEIRANLPIMVEASEKYPDAMAVIAGAPGVDRSLYAEVLKKREIAVMPPIVFGNTFALLKASRVAIVTSGTATLETALLGIPQIACYRLNGSRITYALYRRLLKVDYVTLPNLIAQQCVVPELLLHHCNTATVSELLGQLLTDGACRSRMLEGYALVRERLGNSDAPTVAARDIVKRLL